MNKKIDVSVRDEDQLIQAADLVELFESQLALVGGGIGEVVPA
jgi:hypothetical protein